MNDKYLQDGKVNDVAPADGVKGTIIRLFDGSYAFRVYRDKNNFTDYELRHDELSVIIDRNAMASFYRVEGRHILDHSPQVLGTTINKNSDNQ